MKRKGTRGETLASSAMQTILASIRGEFERIRVEFAGGEKDDVNVMSIGLTHRF